MRKRTRILAARLAACSLSAAMVFTALPPTAVTSYASALEVDLDVEASKEIIGKVGVTGTVPYKASVGKGDVTARTTVVYSSSDESIVTVDTNGKYTLKKKGTATITAVYSCELQDGSVAKTTKYISVKVKDHDFAIQIPEDVTNREIEVGDIGIIAPDCLLDEGSVSPKTLTFASTDNDVVSVASVENTNTAKYTAKKAGTATVTVTATYQPVEGGGTTYTSTKQIVFKVTDKKKPEFTTKNAEFSITDTDTTASGLLSNYVEGVDPAATVEYEIVSDTTSSVDAEKATVTDDGVLKATKAGKVYVKVTVTKDGVSAEGYITVRVVDKRTDASTVAFDLPADKPIEIYAGKSYEIKATVTSGTGKYTAADLTWESSDPNVIQVDKSGNVYGVSAGFAEVTATLPNGNAASTIVTVVEVPEAPTISASQESIEELDINGAEAGIDFNMLSVLDIKNAPTGYKVSYSASSPTDVAFDDNNKGANIATFKKAGVYYVTATLRDKNDNDLASTRIIFAVKNTQVAPEAEITKNTTLAAVITLTKIGETVDYNTGVDLKNADVSDITWKSSNTGAVKIVDGVAVACGEGTSVITASLPNGDYVTWTAKVEIAGAAVVSAEQKEFTLDIGTGISVVYNLATAIEVSNASIDDVVYQTSSPNATVNAGNVTFTKPGTYYVTAAIKDNNITVSSVILTFNVRKTVGAEDKTISLKAGAAGKVKFTEIEAAEDVNSQIDYGNATSADVTWTSSDENVAVVENGVIVSKGEGAAVVSATLSNGNRVAFAVTVKPVSLTAEETEFYIDLKDVDSLNTKYKLGTLLTLKNPGTYNKKDIKYTVYNGDILRVDMNGTVELEGGLGTTYVRAEVGGAYVIFTFHVVDTTAPDPVKIKYNDTMTEKVDRAFTIKAGEVYGSNLKNLVKVIDGNVATDVEWKVDDTSVVSVTDGVVKGLSAGKAVITAVTRNGYYVTFVVTVADGMKLSATQTNFEIDKKELKSLDLNAFLNLDNPDDKTPAAGTAAAVKYSLSDVTLTSSANSIVATTAGSNTVNFESTGTAVVKAEVGGQVVTLTFHVTDTTAPDPVKIDYTTGAKKTITVEEGSVYETSLKDYVTVGDKADLKDVKWDVKDSTVATVTNGIVKGISKGTTVVTATTVDGYYVTFVVTVSGKVELTATETDIDLDMGTADSVDFDLKSVMDAENAKLGELGIVYQTSDPTNAAITSEGKLTFKKAGCYYVTATYNGTANQSVLKFTFHVKKTISDSDINVVLKEGQEKTVALTKIDETVDLNERVTLTPAGTTNAVLTWTTSDESVAAVKDGVVVAKSEGAAVVTATLKNGSYIAFAVTVKPVTMTAEKTSFDVDLKDDKDHTYDLSTMLTLANAPAGSTIKYSDFDEKILTVSDNGVVTFTGGTGVTYVRAECNGAYVIFAFHVVNTTAPDPVKVEYADNAVKSISILEGQAYENNLANYVKVTGGKAEDANNSDVMWSVDDASVATVTNGVVTGVSAGNAVVTAYTADGYHVTFTVTVKKKVELTASRTEFDIDLKEQKSVDLDAYLKLANADNATTLASVACTSSSTDIATVADRKVSFAKTGTVYVKAALNDQVVTFTFHVVDTTAPKPIKVTHKTTAEKSIEIFEGQTYATNLRDYIEVENGDIADVIWTVDDASTATITNGVVKGVSAGNAVITAATKDGYYVTFAVKVKKNFKLTTDQEVFDIDLKEQKQIDLDAYLHVEDAADKTLADVICTSSSTIATVNGHVVTFNGTGTAYVKAELDGKKVNLTFHIVDTTAPAPIKIKYVDSILDTQKKMTIRKGALASNNLREFVEVEGGDISDIIWSSSDESVATISDGVVKGISAGTAVITAATKDGYYVTFDVTVQDVMELSAYKTEFDIDLREQKAVDLDAYLKLTNADADVTLASVVCTSSSTDIATVADHKVSFAKTGTVYVKAALKDQVVTFTFHVVDTTLPDPIKLNYKENAEKNITLTVGEAYATNLREYFEVQGGDISDIKWSVDDDSVVTVTDGVVKALSVGTAVVTASSKDGYYVTFTFKVNPVVKANVVLDTGKSNVVNLTLDSKDAATAVLADNVKSTTVAGADVKGFTWTSSDESVATVASGTVRAQKAGQTVVTVTAPDGSSVSFIVAVSAGAFTGEDQFDASQIVLQLEVTDKESKKLPTVTVDGGKATWSVLDETVAKIAGDNLVQAVGEGLTAAVATAPDGSKFAVSVKVLGQPKASIALNDENTETNIALQLGKDETRDLWNYVKLSMTGEYKTNSGNQGTTDTAMNKNSAVLMSKITWTSSDESVAEVIDGVVAAKAVGKTIVTGTAPDGSMVVFTVTVSAADISGVALKDNESRIVNLTLNDAANNYKDLAAMVEDTCDKINADPATFNWTTADPTVATVSDGVVYAQGKGDTTVTVTAPDGSSVTFIVAVAEGGFAADDTYSEDDLNAIKNWKAELQIGGVESKELPPIKATAGTITWRTDDESIAKISGNSVTAVSEGVTYAIATAPNGSERAFLVTVYANPTLAFEKSSAEVVTGETVLTNVTVNPKNTEVVYTVTCNGEDVVSNDDYVLVSNNGSFSFVPLKAGKFIITGTATIKSKSVSAQLIVNALQDVESVGFTEASKTLYTGRTDDLASLIKWNDGKSDPYNKELTWTSGDESVATVSSTGIVKAVAPGKTYIYATAYNGLKAKIEIVVKQTVTGIELSQTSYELWEGQTDFISATPKPATANIKSITYSSDDEKIATVDTEGKIKAVKGGSTYIKATITWTDEDGKTEKTVTARASILVKAPVTDVVVKRVDTNSSDTIYSNRVGESIQLKAVLTPQNAYDKTILWTSENKDIATVDENGMITTVGKGTTYIYAKCLSGGYGRDGAGTPAVGMIKVVVGGDTLSLSMTPERSEVYPGESVTYKATLAPDTAFEGNVTYESDNAFVTIDKTGVATVAENATAGLATITATMTMADGKTTYTAQSLLYIKTPVNSVKFEKEKMTIYLDEDYNLAPIFNEGLSIPSDTSITWSIKDPSIVTVDSYGKMHAAKLGTTWVYATTYNGKRAEILVKVIAAPKEIKLNKEEITCYTGNVQDISYTFNPTYTTETGVTWTTSDSKVAYYDTYTNKIIPVGGGTCYITVTANDKHFGVVSDKVKVTVRQKPTGIVMKDSKLSKKVGNMFKMNATVLPANAFNTAVYWTSTNPAVASVDEFGVVTCHKKGRATIIAITGNGYTAKCKVKVTGKAKKKGVMYGIANVDGLFIRNSASLQGLQLGQYNCGVSVTIVDTIGEWYKIKYNGGYAYVRSARCWPI